MKSNDNMEKSVIGVDIGGSHITCQLFDIITKEPIPGTKVRKTVNCHAPAAEILDAWAQSIAETCGDRPLHSLSGIGFAMPGPFDYPGGIAWFRGVEKFDSLYGMNIGQEIRSRLELPPGFPVRFLNDAACFAIGESFQEETLKHGRLLAITLGTGFGTTFIGDHLPVAGKYGIPEDGFLYHIPVGNSIADDYFSTRWFLKEYYSISGNRVDGVKELAEKALQETEVARIFSTFGHNLGSFLSPWLRNFDATCLVIGGSISYSFSLFGRELQEEFQNAGLSVSVIISSLQEDAALTGSAALCDDIFYTRLYTQT